MRIDVVGLSDLAFVQDRVEGLGRVAGVEVAACVLAVAVEQQWFPAAEEVDELWYDLCMLLVRVFDQPDDRSAYSQDTDAGPSRC